MEDHPDDANMEEEVEEEEAEEEEEEMMRAFMLRLLAEARFQRGPELLYIDVVYATDWVLLTALFWLLSFGFDREFLTSVLAAEHRLYRSAATHEEMLSRTMPNVPQQVREAGCPIDWRDDDYKVFHVLNAVQRCWFVPESLQTEAFNDRPLVFPQLNTKLSSAHMYPTYLELLDLQPGNSFLDIGSGSGFTLACASILCAESGSVQGWDLTPEIVAFGRQCVANMPRGHLVNMDSLAPVAQFVHNCFWPVVALGRQRFDRISVGAAATRNNRHLIYRLLAPGGLCVLPLETALMVVTCVRPGEYSERVVSDVRYSELEMPAFLPLWRPRHHQLYPPEIREQIFQVLMIWSCRPECPLNMLPLEVLCDVFSMIYVCTEEKQDDELSLSSE